MRKNEKEGSFGAMVAFFGKGDYSFDKRVEGEIKMHASRCKILVAGCTLLFFLFFLLAGYNVPLATASETVFLSTLIEEAKSNNPEILAYRNRIKAKEYMAKREGYLDDPSFKVEIEDIPKDDPLNVSDAMQTRYTFSQMFPFPGKRSLRQKIALKDALVAEAELRDKELEIIAMVKDAYYDYALLAESIKVMVEIKEVLSSMARIAEIKYATGQVSQQDVIKVHLELTMVSNELISLEAEKGVAEAKLKSLLNRPQDVPMGDTEGLTRDSIAVNIDELIKSTIERNPIIKAMEYEVQANELAMNLAKKDYYPDFMLGVAPIQRDGMFDSYDLMFQINIPLWWGKYDSGVQEKKANADVLKSRLHAEKNLKGFEVKSASLKVEASDRIRTLYETTLIPQVELSFESALKNYQTGKVDFLTLLDAERMLKKTRIEYLNSLAEYKKRVAMLERIVGEELAVRDMGQGPMDSGKSYGLLQRSRVKEITQEKEK